MTNSRAGRKKGYVGELERMMEDVAVPPFSTEERRTQTRRVDLALKLLEWMSGGDENDFLQAVAGGIVAKHTISHRSAPKLAAAEAALQRMGALFSSLDVRESELRPLLVSLVAPDFTRTELIEEFGFTSLGKRAYHTAASAFEEGGESKIQHRREGGRPALAKDTVDQIHLFWEKFTAPSERGAPGSRILTTSKRVLMTKIKETGLCSMSSAFKYILGTVKPHTRITDICRNCEDYILLQRSLDSLRVRLAVKVGLPSTATIPEIRVTERLRPLQEHLSRASGVT